MHNLANKRIVLGMTGGVACYKIAELVRRAVEQGIDIDVVMTEAATHFITPVTLQALTGRPVFVSQWDQRVNNNMAHIDLTRGAQAVLIAPASANFIHKLAHGSADDLLSTLCLARDCPLLVAPAMNQQMWHNPATQRNIAQLRQDGITLLGPAHGHQACGETGEGRMLEPEAILADLIGFFQPKHLAGKRVLITAGPTVEPIDPVRVISNRSSGKMGYAIARAACEAGASVTLVTGPVNLPVPWGMVATVNVITGREMHTAVMHHAQHVDIFIATAAVTDWYVKHVSPQKIKRGTTSHVPELEFGTNPDILAEVAALHAGPWCVGFAVETENLAQHANHKRQHKNIPLIVGNLAQHAMGTDTTKLVLFDEKGAHPLPKMDKQDAAHCLIAEIAIRLPGFGVKSETKT